MKARRCLGCGVVLSGTLDHCPGCVALLLVNAGREDGANLGAPYRVAEPEPVHAAPVFCLYCRHSHGPGVSYCLGLDRDPDGGHL